MQTIPLSLATPGMKLVYAIIGSNDAPLANANDVVDDTILRRLDLAGITQIVVYGNAVPGYTMGYDAAQRLERLPYVFRRQQADAFMVKLQHVLHLHFEERVPCP